MTVAHANSGLDYADQRFYASSYGRFTTPDPYRAGTGAGDPRDQRTWNRYAYVGGDPINFKGRSGLFAAATDDDDDQDQAQPAPGSPVGRPAPPRDRAADARQNIDAGALWVTQNLGGTPECDRDLQAVGTNLNDVQNAAGQVQFVDGSTSADLLSGTYQAAAAQAGRALQGTMAEYFASHPGSAAWTTIGAPSLAQSKIYFNEIWFGDPSFLTRDIATITHELLHAITGKTDDVLEGNLGLPSEGQPGYIGSFEITVKLMADCVIGGH